MIINVKHHQVLNFQKYTQKLEIVSESNLFPFNFFWEKKFNDTSNNF